MCKMMPHEYEREIRSLKDRLNHAELKFPQQLIEIENKQIQINFNIQDTLNKLHDDIKNLKEKHGQANPQDTARHQENDKGHKKARKDGQES